MECEIFTMFFRRGELCVEDLDEKVFKEYFAADINYAVPNYFVWLRHAYVQMCAKRGKMLSCHYWMNQLWSKNIQIVIECMYDHGEKVDYNFDHDDIAIIANDIELVRKYCTIDRRIDYKLDYYCRAAVSQNNKIFDVLIDVVGISPEKIIEYINGMDIERFSDSGLTVAEFSHKYNCAIDYIRKWKEH